MNKRIPIKIISTQEQSTLHVRFLPTDICNFDCSYCFPGQKDGKFRYPKNVDTVINNFRKLFDIYERKLNKTRFHLQITGGGDPSLWPHISYFCEEIKKTHNVYITIISNGSRTIRWWKENSKYFDDAVLSFHQEYGDIDHHIAVADTLFEEGLKVTSLVLMNAEKWDECVAAVEKMKTSKYPWYIQTKEVIMAPGMDVDSYTQDQLDYCSQSMKRLPDSDWLLKNFNNLRIYESVVLFDDESIMVARPETIIVNKWNYFKGWTCNVGLETLLINFDGTVTGSCQEGIFNGKIFNVFSDNDFNLDDVEFKSIICPRTLCGCQPETHVTKYK